MMLVDDEEEELALQKSLERARRLKVRTRARATCPCLRYIPATNTPMDETRAPATL
eukprot:COSAG05_NODE_741_length_7601_cov_8.262997_5_plen_56_part_00